MAGKSATNLPHRHDEEGMRSIIWIRCFSIRHRSTDRVRKRTRYLIKGEKHGKKDDGLQGSA